MVVIAIVVGDIVSVAVAVGISEINSDDVVIEVVGQRVTKSSD